MRIPAHRVEIRRFERGLSSKPVEKNDSINGTSCVMNREGSRTGITWANRDKGPVRRAHVIHGPELLNDT